MKLIFKIFICLAAIQACASQIYAQNLLDMQGWTTGTGTTSTFSAIGTSAENFREWGEGPGGKPAVLWRAKPDGGNDADGGWDTEPFSIVHSNMYRFSVWIKKTNSNNGTSYFGCTNVLNLDNTANGNPYFWHGDLPELNKWYLLVGYIHGSGDNSTTHYGGIYDGVSGIKAVSIADFKFPTTATTTIHRSYLYYDPILDDEQFFYAPRVEVVNGNEPSISTLIGQNQISAQPYFSGSVGIGTNTPQASLDIVKSYDVNQNRTLKMSYNGSWGTEAYAKDFRFLDVESTEQGKVLQLNAFGMGLGYNPPGYSSPDKLYINGNVGIGTSTIDNTNNWNRVFQVNGPQHAKLVVTETSGVKVGIYSHTGYNGKIGTESNHNLTFTAGYWNDVMTLTTGGNVGIGTLSPREKLSVNGKIRAHEIKVETANWPDYVFDKSYPLPTLGETEKHIREKGHLPGIPSAAAVKANGIDIGEMNAKLLQKIEELTLHLIEYNKKTEVQDNKIARQQELLEKQQREIKKLKSRLK